MKLRPHQERFNSICKSINNGKKIKDVIAFVVPGGGKSAYCSIASQLIKDDTYKILWVAPRESLVLQAEKGFRGDGIFDVGKHDIRAAGNDGDRFRGNCGAVTTYQAIIADPKPWIALSEKYKLILFLDEYDSLTELSEWSKPIEKIYNNSFLRVCATGTIDRSDSLPLKFTPYNDDGSIDFSETSSMKWIVYNKEQSIIDGSTVPFQARLISGSGSYIDLDGCKIKFDKFTGDGNQLLTAFKTEYAYQMFKLCLKDWMNHRKSHPWAKMIILANNIDIAEKYNEWFRAEGYRFNIATSGNEVLSKETIKRFKLDNSSFQAYDGMIGIGKIYKGLDIKQATFLVFLTNTRGKSWCDQAIGRVQRAYPGKTKAYLYAPNDPKMVKVLKSLSCGNIQNVCFEPQKDDSEQEKQQGGAARTIEALSSEAHIEGIPLFPKFIPYSEIVKTESQSEKEKRLRTEINSVINKIVSKEDAGNRKIKERIFWLKVKKIVNNGRDSSGKIIKKHLKEMSIPELKKIATFSNNYN